MKRFYDYLNEVETTGSTKDKQAILKAALADAETSEQVYHVVVEALNYQRLYYIKELPETVGTGEYDDTWLTPFLDLLEECELAGRTQATKEKVVTWLNSQHPEVAKWCRRVILRDLRSGFGVELANKVGFQVPYFEVQLATDGKKCKKLDKLFPGLAGPKLDGYRCFAVVDGDVVTLLSRNGTEFENFPTIAKAVLELAKSRGLESLILDGEIMSDSFNDMQKSAFASKRGTTVGDVRFHVFDTVPLAEYKTGVFTTDYDIRYKILEDLLKTPTDLVRLVKHREVHSLQEILDLEREYIEQGYEGVMFKPYIPYYYGKDANKMLKFKTMMSQDCVITGLYKGEAGKQFENTLGGFNVLQENGVACNVGGGFTPAMRDEFYAAGEEALKGRCVEVKYQELTPDGVMRFPVFMRFRTDKDKRAVS